MQLIDFKGVVIVVLELDAEDNSFLEKTSEMNSLIDIAKKVAISALSPLVVQSALVGDVKSGKVDVICKI